jgi:hypothetical protein
VRLWLDGERFAPVGSDLFRERCEDGDVAEPGCGVGAVARATRRRSRERDQRFGSCRALDRGGGYRTLRRVAGVSALLSMRRLRS